MSRDVGGGAQKAVGGAGSDRREPEGEKPSGRPGLSPQSSSSRSRPSAATLILVVAARSCSRRLRVWRSTLESSLSISGLSSCSDGDTPTTGDKYLRAEQPRRLPPGPPGPPGSPPGPPAAAWSHRPRPAPVQQGAASCEMSAAMRESPHTARGSPAQKPLTRPSRSRSSHTWVSGERGWTGASALPLPTTHPPPSPPPPPPPPPLRAPTHQAIQAGAPGRRGPLLLSPRNPCRPRRGPEAPHLFPGGRGSAGATL